MEGRTAIDMSNGKYDIPDYGTFSVTLPSASSVFEDRKSEQHDEIKRSIQRLEDELKSNPSMSAESKKIKQEIINGLEGKLYQRKVYKGRALKFLLTGQFGFDVTADYQKGGLVGDLVGGFVDKFSSALSSFGSTGVISQRSATLTYKNSKISGIMLPFVLISESGKNPITDDLDALYRAVLPTFGETGRYSVTEEGAVNVVGSLMDKWGLVRLKEGEKLTDKIAEEGGAISSRVAKVFNVATATVNSYYGVYGQTAPLSYDPTILGSIKGTVGLSVGDYFKCENHLVITKVDVKFSQSCDEWGNPLYAEGNIVFSFVKPIDHITFRGFFKQPGSSLNEVEYQEGSSAIFNQQAVDSFKGLVGDIGQILS